MVITKKKFSTLEISLFIFLSCMAMVSCTNSSTTHSKKLNNTISSKSTVIDTITIHKPCVIFIEPDSTLIEKLKKENGEDAFYEGANDYLHYLTTADDFCKAENVQTYFVTNMKVLQFISSNNKNSYINIQQLNNPLGICFFHPTKEPKLIEISLFEEEYQYYFHGN